MVVVEQGKTLVVSLVCKLADGFKILFEMLIVSAVAPVPGGKEAVVGNSVSEVPPAADSVFNGRNTLEGVVFRNGKAFDFRDAVAEIWGTGKDCTGETLRKGQHCFVGA